MTQKSDHELVPTHEIMSEGEVKQLLKELEISQTNLPKIFSTDPQAVKLGARPGQILRIKRHDGASEYLYYRIVVEA